MGSIERGGGICPQPTAAVPIHSCALAAMADMALNARRGVSTAFKIAALGGLALSLWPPGQAAYADTTPSCNATEPNQVPLQINVSGMRSAKGNITITIYPDEPSHFLDGSYKVVRQQLPVTLPVTSACFILTAAGYYAVALFHDENNNHHLDTNSLGMPTEGYGFSNNPTLYFGPPELKQVRFSVHPDNPPIAIRMKYY
ncbi:MAG: hypothetical protein JWM91_626 [Rhodospirillales bacterium]|nr:hypothetical protein [Rhodospirillales bacterium]